MSFKGICNLDFQVQCDGFKGPIKTCEKHKEYGPQFFSVKKNGGSQVSLDLKGA